MASGLRRCPQCGAEMAGEGSPFRPFCSERCKLIDLGNWLGDRYRIPGAPVSDEASSDDDSSDD